jgi:capsular exopolysaccharide synthesis family protein
MGRIDQALRRANVDVGKSAGAAAPPADPWKFEDKHSELPQPPASAEVQPVMPAVEGQQAPPAAPAHREGRRAVRRPGLNAALSERLVVAEKASPLLVEQFRGLAATLHRAQLEQPLKSIIVTSASPGDGKSHVAVNLALTLSESYGRSVLLVDADMRRPVLHSTFGVPNKSGLSEALKASGDEKVSTVQVGEKLTLLPAGRPEPNPLGGLSSERMKRIVEDACSRFDWVIVDSPPVGVLADARVVAETVDGAILVVRAGATRFPELESAADTIGRERILGLVLNAVEQGEIHGSGYYRDYYGYGRAGDKA